MNILCTICSDLVNSAESVCVTKCGHIFHHHCLAQWNERSKTCPQCRQRVTEKCLFRIYPTISNEVSADDVATLQSRLDDAKLTTRQQTVKIKELEDKINSLTADLKKNEKILHETEKKLVTKESAVCALKEQLDYVKIQNKERDKLKEENGTLQQNLKTLNGLQKVLNATNEEVEKMLESYTDVRTVATFAAALKRALCESESRKNESRDRLLHTQQLLSKEKKDNVEWQHKYMVTYEKFKKIEENMKKIELIHKEIDEKRSNQQKNKQLSKENIVNNTDVRKHQLDLAFCGEQMDIDTTFIDISFSDDEKQENKAQNKLQNSMVNRIENSDSPYLALKQSTMLPLSAIQRKQTKMAPVTMKPSDYMILNKARRDSAPSTSQKQNLDLSIFHKRPNKFPDLRPSNARNNGDNEILYDGLGGHSKLDNFPVFKSPVKTKSVPVLTAKHKLKRPMPSGSQDITSFLKKIKDM